MKTMIAAILLIITVGCANDGSSNPPSGAPNKGKRVTPTEATTVLTSASRWCYDNTTNDAFYATHIFYKNGVGEYAVCHHASKATCDKSELITWNVADDLLTMKIAKTVLTAHLRFLDGAVQLWRDDDTLNSVMRPCAL